MSSSPSQSLNSKNLVIRDSSGTVIQSSTIHSIMDQFLKTCQVTPKVVPRDDTFWDICWEEARHKGFFKGNDETTNKILKRAMDVGIVIAFTAYSHLEDLATKVYIALYTALLVYVDDAFQRDVQPIRDFNRKFALREPQPHQILDRVVECFLEVWEHFDPLAAELMLSSSLDFMSAQLIEHDMGKQKVSPHAINFPAYARVMSGVARFYVLAIFPPEIPVQSYLQAVPDLVTSCHYVNDILSFYKEEIAGETGNTCSTLAALQNIPKFDVLQKICDEASTASERICNILADEPAALQAFKSYEEGYVAFHFSSPRYKLHELFRI